RSTERGDRARSVWVVSAGHPAPGVRVEILSRRGRPVPDGRIGEVALATPSRMKGYLKDKTATNRALRSGFLRTGDLGYKRNGELFWVGRLRERINVYGRKLDPSDFEYLLLTID